MTNEDSRTERVAAILEKQFLICAETIDHRTAPDSGCFFPEYLIKISAQLAGAIVRLETCVVRTAKNSGSIPQ